MLYIYHSDFHDCAYAILFWKNFVKWYSVFQKDYKITKRIVLQGHIEGSCLESSLILSANKHIYYTGSQGSPQSFIFRGS